MASKKGQIGGFGVLFWVLAGFFALSGMVKLTEATVGVGLIAFACYLAILARIAQASYIGNKFNKENEGK